MDKKGKPSKETMEWAAAQKPVLDFMFENWDPSKFKTFKQFEKEERERQKKNDRQR